MIYRIFMLQLPEVKQFIYGDFETRYESGKTQFKKIPGMPPVAVFYAKSGREMERIEIETFSR